MEVFCKRLFLLLVTLVVLCGCARKVYKETERVTADTTRVVERDSVFCIDTLHRWVYEARTDSVRDSTITFVVVDAQGKVISKTTYRERNVYHNKDAHVGSNHVTSKKTSKERKNERRTDTNVVSVKKVEKPPSFWLGVRVAAFVAMGVVLYLWIYKKRK